MSEVGGDWLQLLMTMGGVCSGDGLMMSYFCTSSRAIASMATMDIFPGAIGRFLGRLSPRGIPANATVTTAALTGAFAVSLDFSDLVAVSSFFYAARLLLILVALPANRFRYPTLHRPFQVPLGNWGLVAAVAFPIAFCMANLVACSMLNVRTLLLGPGAAAATFVLAGVYVLCWRPDGFQGRIVPTRAQQKTSDYRSTGNGSMGGGNGWRQP